MKTRLARVATPHPSPKLSTFPDADALAALRAWYAGLSSRAAVERYLSDARPPGASARGLIGTIRRQLIAFARERRRPDLAALLAHPADERRKHAEAVGHAIEVVRALPLPVPQITDDVDLWLSPRVTRVLRARGIATLAELTVRVDDYTAVQAWLALHEAPATQRAYRKEAERLILWAIVERGRALSSLTTEDAIAYRAFLRHPTPRERWIGPPRPRTVPDWRPFAGNLSARSTAYALSVLGALFRWLIEQRYVLANPFAGIKVHGRTRVAPLDTARGFTEGEWLLVRTLADGLEWSNGWSASAAQRLRFLLDFAYATGLRASELVGATLGDVSFDERGDHWLHVVGKGHRPGKVALPPLARTALDRYLVERRLPFTPRRWEPRTPLLASLDEDRATGITGARLWHIMRRFFRRAADVIGADYPVAAEKLRRASPHWMRHTHATHALARGAELTSVRDNLRHASIATTSMYLHSDDIQRARQMAGAFTARK
ncbi:site-specific recombinase XerD [Trinickia symbiotica]|uniref:Integrase n=1 Tax=Trinickia symbiotica TaxID=863227 RepID=A0A2N7X063_9BURK|nr:tyrosine-type recombinase/integrase [Trinickia symbiotica]PMS34972.1 integrase [Trinickia symbiotica]PPK43457.1 site-specific recombinase XerD [Trinickia symbiotica]